MKPLAVGLVVLFAALSMSCRNPITQAGDEADRAIEKVDRSVEKAEGTVDRLIDEARKDIKTTVVELRAEAEGLVSTTGEEVDELREAFKKDLDDLDDKVEKRMAQIEAASLKVIAEGDEAVEARINQLFAELRLFVKETLASVRELILPVLGLTEKLSALAGDGQEHFATVVAKILEVIEKVSAILTEVQASVRKMTGRDPVTGDDSGGEGLAGLIAGVLATLLAGYTQWKRVSDHKEGGARAQTTKAQVSALMKSGELDDEIRGRLVALGMISTKPNGGEAPSP